MLSVNENATGIELVAVKAHNNREHKGYTAEHDDGHKGGELGRAAMCYIERAILQGFIGDIDLATVPADWPFEEASWKPSDDPIRNLVHAGALVVAEIDRLKRARGERTDHNGSGMAEIGHDARGQVLVQFGTFLSWVEFTPEQAAQFAQTILHRVSVVRAANGDTLHAGDDDLLDAISGAQYTLEQIVEELSPLDDANDIHTGIQDALDEVKRAGGLRVSELQARPRVEE